MPTSRSSLFLTSALLLLAFFSGCEALPTPNDAPQNEIRSSPSTLEGYVVPVSDGSTSLPTPIGTLKAIALGYGTQNYTCAAASAATPTPVAVAIGAKATLYNTNRITSAPESVALPQLVEAVGIALNATYRYSTPVVSSFIQQQQFQVLGYHYFNGAGQPTFDLTSSGTGFLVAKKIGDIPAPSNATAGEYGAVDWLALSDAGGSQGLSEVYRVETAGGKAGICDGTAEEVYIPYAALYWFYE